MDLPRSSRLPRLDLVADQSDGGVEPLARPRLVSIVVPLLNEEATLGPLYAEVSAALAESGFAWELVYVDDGSTDGSYRELLRLHDLHPNVRVVRLRRNFGKAAALAAGFEEAAGEVVVTMDADLQDDPAEIPRLVAKLDEGYDLVAGWKRDRKDPLVRRVVSHVYNTATRVATGVRLHDMNCGLKVYRAEVLDHVRLYGERHRFVPVLAHHFGYSVTELPVNHRPRLNGRSRFGIERGVGVMLGLSGFAILLYLTTVKIGGAGIGDRPLLLLGVLLVVVGIQFLSLGLIGEMLTSQHEENAQASAATRAYVRDVLR
jgi:dolichol-phosphate mannosyltransferase